MNFLETLSSDIIITEGSVIERIRRDPELHLDPYIENASFIYDDDARMALKRIYKEYLDIGLRHNLPMIILTPTWRANQKRIESAGYSVMNVNCDNARFLNCIRKEYGDYASKIFIGGLTGPSGDAYKAEEALGLEDAEVFHRFQIEKLAASKVDFLIASTIPALSEARGIARVMSHMALPYIISFVIDKQGKLLDGTSLDEAISTIDSTLSNPPSFYMINCVHSSVYTEAARRISSPGRSLSKRLLGIQANTSRLSHSELDGRSELDSEPSEKFAAQMACLPEKFGARILGGCCGTDNTHIEALAEKIVSLRSAAI